MDELDFYRRHSPVTDPGAHRAAFAGLPADVAELAEVVRGVVLHRDEAKWRFGLDLTEARRDEANTRHTAAILDRLGADLAARPVPERFAGTCRDFSVLLCAALREAGVPARVRVGFAGYFAPDFFDDHWVVEWWHGDGWRLVDAQLAGGARAAYGSAVDHLDVPRDGFLVAGRAWQECRAGDRDPGTFGVHSVGLTGMWEVQGNLLRDLAALNGVEVLPWDNWGLIPRHYDELTAAELALLDRVAVISAAGGPLAEAVELYRSEPSLQVPGDPLTGASLA
ncbi:hypothetical protein Cs7R123_51390 [Catellatospora sp. TT07R-123]|uniref:transglutaminase-like domain-containing protein n=1 Tax=Catellatospora sp. TT07R-123 TaxID=2733863 RepID=UPI001B24BBE5|nr:transglutaminase-like domain-containing protein [Catellatospora sp. TT07R-123]GHJ47797.1 hypothetical protein Cs7R123_51390 [Catellatospora sp. TT07R-123]